MTSFLLHAVHRDVVQRARTSGRDVSGNPVVLSEATLEEPLRWWPSLPMTFPMPSSKDGECRSWRLHHAVGEMK